MRWHDTGLPTPPAQERLISQRSGANLQPGESGISRKLKLSTFPRSEVLILESVGVQNVLVAVGVLRGAFKLDFREKMFILHFRLF